MPGGESGLPGSPNQTDQLSLWLANEYHPLPVSLDEVRELGVYTLAVKCGDGEVGPGEQCDDANTDENDGCNEDCRVAAIITCLRPTVAASDDACTAEIACNQVASCSDPDGGEVTLTCDPGGPRGLGTENVPVECVDASDDTTFVFCEATVADMTPPSLTVEVPDLMWPPNHRLVAIHADVSSADACGTSTVVLNAVTSGEPEDAPGEADGETTGDIQGAAAGTADFDFELRAERTSEGSGRTYTVTYAASDEAGNETINESTIHVPIDRGGVVEPVKLALEENANGTAVRWDPVAGAASYNVVRSRLSDIGTVGQTYSLGTVTCIESGSVDENTNGNEDSVVPQPGEAFVYVVEYVEYVDGTTSAHGTESAAKPRVPEQGDCN
ncbi:MAG: DUF4215 domain-containing protein [Acidobacteriota bacterium]|nr:MAG: DUF4215 domain-containing protein [Acidobacteriota bacterium]